MISKLLNLIYPNKCIFCNSILDFYSLEKKEFTCNNCKKNLEYIRGVIDIQKASNKHFDYFVCAYNYEKIVRKLLLDFKFYNKKYLRYFLASDLSRIIKKYNIEKVDYITYVPISFKRYIERGYNQSELIANCISHSLGIPLLKYCLIKIKHNQVQSSLSLTSRRLNVVGVYKVLFKKAIKGKNIILIDDIYTTGSTVDECSKVLKDAGANRIIVATVAKAIN